MVVPDQNCINSIDQELPGKLVPGELTILIQDSAAIAFILLVLVLPWSKISLPQLVPADNLGASGGRIYIHSPSLKTQIE